MTDQQTAAKRTILIVDDDVNLSALIKLQLEAKGYRAVSACTGLEGLEALRSLTPDLIIMDINMPEMSGIDLYRKLLTTHGRVRFPVLVLTSRRELEGTFEDIDAAGFLSKPFLAEDLVREVERILSSRVNPAVLILDLRQDHIARQIQDALEGEKYQVFRITDRHTFIEKAADLCPDVVVLEYDKSFAEKDSLLKKIKDHPRLGKARILVHAAGTGVEGKEAQRMEKNVDKLIINRGDYVDFIRAVREFELQGEA